MTRRKFLAATAAILGAAGLAADASAGCRGGSGRGLFCGRAKGATACQSAAAAPAGAAGCACAGCPGQVQAAVQPGQLVTLPPGYALSYGGVPCPCGAGR